MSFFISSSLIDSSSAVGSDSFSGTCADSIDFNRERYIPPAITIVSAISGTNIFFILYIILYTSRTRTLSFLILAVLKYTGIGKNSDSVNASRTYMEQFPKQNREKVEHPADKLCALMTRMSEQVNSSVREAYGIHDLVDERGAISMDGFVGNAGYTKEGVEADKNKIFELEVEWNGAREARVREFYATQYDAHTEEDIVRIRAQHKEKEKGRQMEIFTAILFNKMLKDDFIVVPASAYDDYMNGIDTVMVNKKTGDVVCTFDEVHDHKASNRADAKEEKIKKKARAGGSTLAYGIQ